MLINLTFVVVNFGPCCGWWTRGQ